MIKNIKFFTILALTFFSINHLSAQNLKADMKSIMKTFEENSTFNFDVKVSSYSSIKASNPNYSMQYTYAKNKESILIKENSRINFSSNKFQVVIDEDKKLMYILEIQEESKKEKNGKERLKKEEDISFATKEDLLAVFNQSFDSLNILYRGTENNIKRYVILNRDPMVERIEININTETNFLHNLKYFYTELYSNMYVEIDYININAKENYIDYSNFFSKNNHGEFIGKGKYSKYKIIL